MAIYRPIHVRR